MSKIIFEDFFSVKDINSEKNVFEKVSRLDCQSDNYEMDLVLDVNTEIYPVEINDKFKIVLVTSLYTDGAADDVDVYDQSNRKTVAERFEYVMYGRVFDLRHEPGRQSGAAPRVSIYVSFGGLLMRLKGDPRYLNDIDQDTRLYLLMNRIK